MQAAAAAALRSTGRIRKRFFNTAALRAPVYARCLLPAVYDGAPPSPNVAPPSAWTCVRTVTGGYHHEHYRPPPGLADGLVGPNWSAPFARFFPQTLASDPAPAEAPPPTKKRKPFQRAQPLEGHLRTVAIRMWPTPPQRRELLRCFAMARHAYNFACGAALREGRADLSELRKRWKAEPLPPWASRPEERVAVMFQARAIQDLVNSLKTNMSKRRKTPDAPPFELHFRSLRRTPTEVLHIEKDYTGKPTSLRFEPLPAVGGEGAPGARRRRAECLAVLGNNLKGVGGIRLQDHPRIIERLLAEGRHLKEEAKLRWDKRVNAFHLLYTYELPRLPDPDPTFKAKRVVACDPGCYPFQAWYAPRSGEHGALLVGGTDTLIRRCHAIDRRCGRLARLERGGRSAAQVRRRRRRMRRALARERARLRGWVQDAHYDAANTLLRAHDLILQPRLAVQELTVTSTRTISDRTARAMLAWSHGKYIERLRSAAARYAGRHVLETFEPGTSKTCTHCGAWSAALEPRDKTYACERCGLRFDRQLAGARNNLFAAYGAAVGIGWDGQEGV